MNSIDWGNNQLVIRSRLKEVVMNMEREQGKRIFQKEIAEATGITEKTISRWMSYEPLGMLDPNVITELCRFLGINIGDLVYIQTVAPSD